MKVFENKFSQVVEKSFNFILCLFGFTEATKFRFEQIFRLGSKCVSKELPPLSVLYVKQKKNGEQEKA